MLLEATIYILRTGVPWLDLPEWFGKWSSDYTRWRRRISYGFWERILSALAQGARGCTRFVESTFIKLHQDGTNPAGGQQAQCIGLTKGGLNTKLTALVDSYGRAVSLSLLPGQCSEIEALEPHLCRLRGRTLVGDKGFDADSLRERVRGLGDGTCTASLVARIVADAVPFAAGFITVAITSKTSFAQSNAIVV